MQTMKRLLALALCVVLLAACAPLAQAEETCTHENAMINTTYYELYSGDWVSNGDGTHTGTAVLANWMYCPDCDDGFAEYISEPTVVTEDCNLEGGCGRCGYLTDCEHPEDTLVTEEFLKVVDNVYKNDMYHTVICNPMTGTTCGICGMFWEDVDTSRTEEFDDMHRYGNFNVCIECDFVNPCTHEETVVIPIDVQKSGFASVDETAHSFTASLREDTLCTQCGQTLEQGALQTDVAQTEAHYFEDGACRDCGYAGECAHLNVSVEYSDEILGSCQDKGDMRFHMVLVRQLALTTCADCGKTWTDDSAEPTLAAFHHAYDSDGVCDECGYTQTTTDACETHAYGSDGLCTVCGAECPHENTTDEHFHTMNSNFVYVDETSHTCLRDVYVNVRCDDCGILVEQNVFSSSETVTEAHEYSNGKCNCGATLETDCEHAEYEEYEYWTSSKLNRIDDLTHRETQNKWKAGRCLTCNSTWDIEQISIERVVTSHTYISGSCGCGDQYGVEEGVSECNHIFEDGVCIDCGAANDCEHPKRQTYIDNDYSSGPVAVDGLTHTGVADVYKKSYCAECGETYENELVSSDTTITEKHLFFNGACYECGYENTCEHAETYLNDWHYYPEGAVDNGDGTHTGVAKVYEETICSTCGEIVNSELVSSDEPATAAHQMQFGVCTVCWYACPHENAEDLETETQKNAVSTNNGDGTHTHEYDLYHSYNCLDCGTAFDLFVEHESELGLHEFADGTNCIVCGAENVCTTHTFGKDNVCIVCGEASTCEHVKTGGWINDWYEMVFLEPENTGDPDFHRLPYTVYSMRACSVCSQTFMYGEEMEGEECHTYDADGVCACGATGEPTTCEHANKESLDIDHSVTYPEEYISADGHTAVAEVYSYMRCTDCGIYTQRQLWDPAEERVEAHAYVDGVCACGYACPHASTTSETTRVITDCISYDTLSHGVTYDETTTTTCADCGHSSSDTAAGLFAVEVHVYGEDGVCLTEGCGSVEADCEHENYEVLKEMFDYDVKNYLSFTETGHTSVYTNVTYGLRCSNCGCAVGSETLESETLTEAHRFSSGKCNCGYVNPCEHAVTENDTVYLDIYEFTPVDENIHKLLARIRVDVLCSSCGEVLERGEVQDNVETTAEHYFSEQGRCLGCGYQKTVVTLALPSALEQIEAEAFAGLTVEAIIIPDGCVSIGERAFAQCASLTSVTIPASVQSIAADAFEGCEGLTIAAPEGSYAQTYAQEQGYNWIAE